MNITVAHFGTHYVDMPGGERKQPANLRMPWWKKVMK